MWINSVLNHHQVKRSTCYFLLECVSKSLLYMVQVISYNMLHKVKFTVYIESFVVRDKTRHFFPCKQCLPQWFIRQKREEKGCVESFMGKQVVVASDPHLAGVTDFLSFLGVCRSADSAVSGCGGSEAPPSSPPSLSPPISLSSTYTYSWTMTSSKGICLQCILSKPLSCVCSNV